MPGRRSERSRKAVNYSKFAAEANDSDKDDDDDFAEPTPPSKKRRTKKLQDSTKSQKKDEENGQKPKERKSRNRLSEEEKYQLQLEEALKMSLANSNTAEATTENMKTSQESNQSSNDTQTSCVVQAEVLDSPNTKSVQNSKRNKDVEVRKETILNEAAQSKDDEIILAPVEENKEIGRRKRGTEKNEQQKEEEDYDMSSESESESEDEMSADEESDFSDYVESPKKKTKSKKPPPPKEKKPGPVRKVAVPKKTTVSRPTGKQCLKEKENTMVQDAPTPVKSTLVAKTFAPKISTSAVTLKSSSTLQPKRSPLSVPNLGKFTQRGWTPPRPAGVKTDVLKSPQSPNLIRVGLSRNARLTPLHSKIKIK